MFIEVASQGCELAVQVVRDELGAEQSLPHTVENVLRAPDILKAEPESAVSQPLSSLQPFQEASDQGGLPRTAKPMDEHCRSASPYGPLQPEQGCVATDETVRVLLVSCLRRKPGFSGRRLHSSSGGKRQIQGILVVEDGNQPVLEGKAASSADAALRCKHLLAAGAHGLSRVPGFKQTAIEGGQEHLASAHVERIRHRRDAADSRAEEGGRYRGEGIFGAPIHHGRLAGIEHHTGKRIFQKKRAKLFRSHGGRASIFLLKDKPAKTAAEGVPGRSAGGIRPVCSVPVKVEDVIEMGVLPKMLTEPVEGWRPQDVDMSRETLLPDELHQRAGQRTVAHISFIRAGGDKQDVDTILRQLFGKSNRVSNPVEPPFNLAGLGKKADFRIMKSFPWPGQYVGIVARNLQTEVLVASLHCHIIEPSSAASGKKGLVSGCPPLPQRILNVFRAVGFRGEGIVQEAFEIPAQFGHEVALRAAFHGRPEG